MRFIGLDAGSVSVKAVVLDEAGGKVAGIYRVHGGHPLRTANEVLRELSSNGGGVNLSITGSAGRLLAEILGIEPVNEIVAQAYSTRKLHPEIKSIIELGGEDSKLIALGEKTIEEFSMNSVCAAGTGSFLDQQAERLRLTIGEFSELALESMKPPRIAGRCSVFAKSDMIHLQQIATPVADIVAGLCFAVARNFKGAIARGRQVKTPISFQGGVAANNGMVRAFREVFELDELFVPPDFALMGAWGAALKSRDEGTANPFDLSALDKFLSEQKPFEKGYIPLGYNGNDFSGRHMGERNILVSLPHGVDKVDAYLGIDIGSISTNLAVIDDEGNLYAKKYLMTAGRPIEAVRQGLREIAEEIGGRVEITGVGTTGSGRYMIADYVSADIVKNEITAQATAAAFIDPTVDTILEIGGQDSKYISMRDGVIVDFEMNKACAAGTGSFLEEQAEKLDISVKNQFASLALDAENPLKLGERCTVFMENSLMANLQKGAPKDDLLSGLAYSIVQNYINRVVAGKHIGENIFFQGGVAFNKAVVAAFEKYLGREITVPPNHDVTGAIGMALIARDYIKETGRDTIFKGFDVWQRPYEISSFECKGCPNVCEINRVKIEGEKQNLFYGGRCEKYDIRRKKASDAVSDHFAFRENLLRESAEQAMEDTKNLPGPSIGIPYIFFFHEMMPYWAAFLRELGFRIVVSPRTDRRVVSLGLETVLSEACYPVKVGHGHLRWLKEAGVDAIFSPSFINVNSASDEFPMGIACPHVQAIPYISRMASEGAKIILPAVDFEHGTDALRGGLYKAFRQFGVSRFGITAAIEEGERAQSRFRLEIGRRGSEALKDIPEKSVVIVGRAYNAFDRGMNLEIPEKLATLGVHSLPMDFLPLDEVSISSDWPNMYWRSGQRIMKAAKFIKSHPRLYPIFIGNFSCGPDSFILKFFRRELGVKPFLHIEIDEHSADAGAITRCEAFLDSIGNERRNGKPAESNASFAVKPADKSEITKRKIFIPRMCDHAFALAAAFQRCGVESEVMPPSDRETIDIGMRHVSGKECYPCAVTTGDMLKVLNRPDTDPDRTAFFMPSGTGPCRFGQYNVFHKHVLEDAGFPQIPVFAPNQDEEFYKNIGVVGSEFSLHAWKGIIAYELLYKCLTETRPYEVEKGASDALYNKYLDIIYDTLKRRAGDIEGTLLNVRREFEAVERTGDKKPLVGIVGEIFVRTSRFSNEDLVRKVEELGGQAWLAPFEEWVYYLNDVSLRKAWRKRKFGSALGTYFQRMIQKKIEHKYGNIFKGFLKTLHEPDTTELFRKAEPWLHYSFEGEAVLSVGKAIDYIDNGACGVLNAMPFGCLPGTIVTALMRGVTKKYGIPALSIPYDGTESQTMTIQLEAFMDQARDIMRAQEEAIPGRR